MQPETNRPQADDSCLRPKHDAVPFRKSFPESKIGDNAHEHAVQMDRCIRCRPSGTDCTLR